MGPLCDDAWVPDAIQDQRDHDIDDSNSTGFVSGGPSMDPIALHSTTTCRMTFASRSE